MYNSIPGGGVAGPTVEISQVRQLTISWYVVSDFMIILIVRFYDYSTALRLEFVEVGLGLQRKSCA